MDFQLILKEKSKKKPFQLYQFYTYFGINKAYCFIEQIGGKTFDICCLDEQIKVSDEDIILNEFNYLENDTRSRIVLINAPMTVLINKSKQIYSFIPFSIYENT